MHRLIEDTGVRLFDEQIKHEDRRFVDEIKEERRERKKRPSIRTNMNRQRNPTLKEKYFIVSSQ